MMSAFVHITLAATTFLDADGPRNTYELINSVLAPGKDAIEAPDTLHKMCEQATAGPPPGQWPGTLRRLISSSPQHLAPSTGPLADTA